MTKFDIWMRKYLKQRRDARGVYFGILSKAIRKIYSLKHEKAIALKKGRSHKRYRLRIT